jgi:DNA anti-recombination protein RmuC
MVDQGKAVDKTTAGEELNRELARLKTQFEADLETFRQQEREAHDEKLKQVMHDMRTEKEAFVRRVEEEQEALRSDRREEQRLLEQKFHDHMIRLRREQRAREYKIEELENTLRQERNVVDGRFQRVLDESSAKIEELRRSIAAARMQDC